jgi:phosphoserine phosphatase
MELLHPQSKRAARLSVEDNVPSDIPSSISDLEISLFDLVREIPYLQNAIHPGSTTPDLCVIEPDFGFLEVSLGRAALECAVTSRLLCAPYLEKQVHRVFDLLDLRALSDVYSSIESLLEATRGGIEPRELFDVEKLVVEFYACCFAGLRQSDLRGVVSEILSLGVVSSRESEVLREFIASVESSGLSAVLVSSSLQPLVAALVEELDVSCSAVLGTNVRMSEEGRLLPEVLSPACYGEGKVKFLQSARYVERPLIVCGSLCERDLALLQHAHLAVLLDPKEEDTTILEFAQKQPVLIVRLNEDR